MYINPNFPVYLPSPSLLPNYFFKQLDLERGVFKNNFSLFFSEGGPVVELCVCVCVCVQSRGGYMFALVRLSVYVYVPPRDSVRQNASVISFPSLPKKHG